MMLMKRGNELFHRALSERLKLPGEALGELKLSVVRALGGR